jgi:hypothetical protein
MASHQYTNRPKFSPLFDHLRPALGDDNHHRIIVRLMVTCAMIVRQV